MRVAYIAGPFRGESSWAIEQNIRRAEELALEAWRKGFAVICPHTNTRFFQGAAEDSIWLNGDIELLRRSDLVITTNNWHYSSGATAEVSEARRIGIPVFHSVEEAK